MSMETDELAGRITLRKVELPADEEFLRGLYKTTRDDMASLPLDETQKTGLIEMQFTAQAQSYSSRHPGADHYIVQLDGKAVGRYFVDRQPGEILGIDLALLPEYRSLGIGSFIIRSEFALAAETNRAFTFEVLRSNERAFQLYLRLGCIVTGDTGTHYLIAWRPSDHQTRTAGRD